MAGTSITPSDKFINTAAFDKLVMLSSLIEESRTLAALRDTLLPKLVSGQVRVGDIARFVE